ncbi:hypothetical protein K1719_008625 [Acacia pycnantha]|nr:hypothetical protein K1719_008625 [Acacia pycnantha]
MGDIDINFQWRDVIVEELSGAPQRIHELHPSYLPLQYPLLFPRGEDGYGDDIDHFLMILVVIEQINKFAGYPDLFITFKCNPSWPEITRFCTRETLTASNRADILSRILRLKLKALMNVIKQKKLFGNVRAEVYTIEFQKRVLPHAHILIWLAERDKIKEPEDVDKIISAEIPNPDSDPQMYELVQKFMMHSPCGPLNPKAQCMVDKRCNKFFPKKYNPHTIVDHERLPTYRRRDDGRSVDIKGIPLDNRFPPVERLSFHLLDQQCVIYSNTDDVAEIIAKPRVSRLTHAAPPSGEFYYLGILLTKVKGPSSYEAIRTVHGVVHPTYHAACIALGLLDDDCEFVAALKEASMWAVGQSLRAMFMSMLLCCCLTGTRLCGRRLLKFYREDLLHIPHRDPVSSTILISASDKEQAALIEIRTLLQKNGKSISDFPSLPMPSSSTHVNVDNHLIRQELNYNKVQLQKQSEQIVKSLNVDQQVIYNTMIGEIVLFVVSSGIAATLLQSGRTAHSRFAIPIAVNEDSMCNIKQNSLLADLIKVTKLIIWDEAPMVQRFCIEAFDRTLKDIMHCNKPFGGKAVLMGCDFRQLLPVIPNASRATIVNACITSSSLWDSCSIFNLTKNMWLSCSSNQEYEELQAFSKWLLNIGDGNLGLPHDGIAQVEISDKFLIRHLHNPMQAIVSATYPGLLENLTNSDYFNSRAILCPTIESVNQINEYMCSLLPGQLMEYYSCDTICKSSQ